MDELRNKIMSSIDDSSIPDLSYSIKTIFKDRLASKKTPWYKRKLTWGIAIPALTCATVCAIVLPLTVFKNKEQKIVPVIPVVNQALPSTEVAYSISTLSLANAISANTDLLSEVSNSVLMANDPNQPGGQGGGNPGGWEGWDGWGYMPNGQNSLREVLKYCSQYMYVADKMINNKLSALPDEFTHTSLRDGREQYNCVFNKDENFECSFDFTEKLSYDKTEVGIAGVLGVKKNNLVVEGSRKNVENDQFANVRLDVKFEKSQSYKNWWEQKNPVLSFRERINEKNDAVYTFTYSESNKDIYIVEMSCIGSSKLGDETYGSLEMNVTTYVKTQTGYWPGAGYGYYYQPVTYPFTIEKDHMGNLLLYLYSYGSKLFIDVRDNQGRYYYYLSDYNKEDCFGDYGKH